MAEAYDQDEWINYDVTYAFVTHLETIGPLLKFGCCIYFKLYRIEVNFVFLMIL